MTLPSERVGLEVLATIVRDATGAVGITCGRCGRTSWLAGDVRGLYCEPCRRFHDEPELALPEG